MDRAPMEQITIQDEKEAADIICPRTGRRFRAEWPKSKEIPFVNCLRCGNIHQPVFVPNTVTFFPEKREAGVLEWKPPAA